jgi:pimeloyl-ACP methyl ester carboxylesterase
MNDLKPLPVVLLHGLIGSLDDPAIAAALHPHSVFSPSLLGYGANADIDPATITLSKQAEYVAQLARTKFGRGPVHVVGHSVGGVVAALLAVKYPELVASWAEDQAASFDVVQGAGHMMMLEDGDGFGQLLVRIIKAGRQQASSASKDLPSLPVGAPTESVVT